MLAPPRCGDLDVAGADRVELLGRIAQHAGEPAAVEDHQREPSRRRGHADHGAPAVAPDAAPRDPQHGHHHTCLIASIGSSRAARTAGTRPPTSIVSSDTTADATTAPGAMASPIVSGILTPM